MTHLQRVRLIQHELSHNFGAYDNQTRACSSNQRCIMNDGLWDIPLNQMSNIWCTNCRNDFDPTLNP